MVTDRMLRGQQTNSEQRSWLDKESKKSSRSTKCIFLLLSLVQKFLANVLCAVSGWRLTSPMSPSGRARWPILMFSGYKCKSCNKWQLPFPKILRKVKELSFGIFRHLLNHIHGICLRGCYCWRKRVLGRLKLNFDSQLIYFHICFILFLYRRRSQLSTSW